ncbi:MAG TPA: helix-hairpin-helix domain-containing protein [Acidobacteriaceae bacterium]|nr:helix-hairpin-helix domain-containing protein [Acidobacteriaceae bacterium]
MNGKNLKFAFYRLALVISSVAGIGLLNACTTPKETSDQRLQEEAERATIKARQQSKEALEQARIAAANAQRKVDDIAAGVRQGMKAGRPGERSSVDLNTASASELASLPGISEAKARQIIRHRPYASTHQLVDRGLVSESRFAEISPHLTVR